MKRTLCAMLAAAMLLLPCAAFGDVIWEPEDSFYRRHQEECFHEERRAFIASGVEGFAYIYDAPDRGDRRKLDNGSEVYCEWFYTDENGAQWACMDADEGWINLHDFKIKYDWIAFEEEHRGEIREETVELDASDGAGDAIIFYAYPGSERKDFEMSLSNFGGEMSVSKTYTDDEGRRWGFVGYWYGRRNLWISLDDPTAEVPPAAEQPEPIGTGAPEYTEPKGGGALIIAGGGLAALAAVAAALLIRKSKRA